MPDERRSGDSGKWDEIISHMATQTAETKNMGANIKEMKDNMGTTNILELRNKVGEHSTFINRLKGGGVVIIGGWAAIKLYLSNLPKLLAGAGG